MELGTIFVKTASFMPLLSPSLNKSRSFFDFASHDIKNDSKSLRSLIFGDEVTSQSILMLFAIVRGLYFLYNNCP